ncbi:MAG: NADP-dependent oxidoreductase [Acidobacteriota bacterium]
MTENNLQILLASRPEGLPNDSNFKHQELPVRDPEEGEVLVRVIYLSLDPAMRGWMTDRKSYVPPIGIGELMRGLASGEVVASRHEGFSPGDRVAGLFGWQRFATVPGKGLEKLPPGVPLPLAMGPLGMTGMTAYFGLLDVGEPKEGETVLVSGGAGAVGSIVGQIARVKGCRVVGIAGTDDKCSWLEDDLGFDAAINYKTANLDEAFKKTCPKGIDVYFDNVGGETLNTALKFINRGARVVICGAISQYNATEPVPGPSNYLSLLINRARMEGFIIFDYQDRFGPAQAEMLGWIQDGKIQARSDIVDGLENAPQALLRLFDGSNTGKLLVQVGPE